MNPQPSTLESVLNFDGELSRHQVPRLWQSIKRLNFERNQLDIELDKVTNIDSSGLVMLIHLIQHAKSQNCHIMFRFVPKQLITLLQLSNIEDLFEAHIKIN